MASRNERPKSERKNALTERRQQDDFDTALTDRIDQELTQQDGDGDESVLAALNDPNTASLGPAPLIGGSGPSSRMYGREASSQGRASSPKLFAQASQFPTCVQLRVWRWENGIPVGLGAINSEASEEDFVQEFYPAMPRNGQGRMQFKLRPIDMQGEELGKEMNLVISEHHVALQAINRARKLEAEEAAMANTPSQMFAQPQDEAGSAYATELSRMFEKAVDAADTRATVLENTLQDERERLRADDEKRAQERIDLATRAAEGVQSVTERMMRDESARADRALKLQTDQSQLLLTTLTQIFASAQTQQQAISDGARAADQSRLDRERQYNESLRAENADRHKRTIDEMDARAKTESIRLENERKALQDQRTAEQRQAETKAAAEKAELLTKVERDKQEANAKLERDKAEITAKALAEEARLANQWREQEARIKERASEADRKALAEKAEREDRLTRDRNEWENRWRMEATERDRRDKLEREERERLAAIAAESKRLDAEERSRKDKIEADERARRDKLEAEERERRNKLDTEERESRRLEAERRAAAELALNTQREAERHRAHEFALKQLDSAGQKDREHSERMLKVQEMQLSAAQAQIDAREAERIRAHERMMKEAEAQVQKDREHAERMMQLSQMQNQNQALGGLETLLPKAQSWMKTLGLEPAELIQRMFMPEPQQIAGGGSGWAEALPKVLSSIAEMGKVALESQVNRPANTMPQMMPGAAGFTQPIPGMLGMPGMPGMAGMPGMPVAPGQNPYNLPPGARMTAVPGYPGLMQVQLPAAPTAQNTPTPEPTYDFGESANAPEPEIPGAGGLEPLDAEQAPENEPQQEEERPEPMSPLRVATEAGLSMETQRRARKAIRVLVRQLGGKKQDTWQGLMASAISNEIGIYHYVKAVTIRAALIEAGADEDLCTRVLTAMRESGLIPSDVDFE